MGHRAAQAAGRLGLQVLGDGEDVLTELVASIIAMFYRRGTLSVTIDSCDAKWLHRKMQFLAPDRAQNCRMFGVTGEFLDSLLSEFEKVSALAEATGEDLASDAYGCTTAYVLEMLRRHFG
jgi:hypothetical protein